MTEQKEKITQPVPTESSSLDIVKEILKPDPDNQFWPLPKNYISMSEQSKRAARMGLLTAWYDPDDPTTMVVYREAFVRAFFFFREYYMKGWVGNNSHYSRPSPLMHYEWLYDITYPLTAICSWRSSAKSTVIGRELPIFLALVRKNLKVMVQLRNKSFTRDRIREIDYQLSNNERIIEDFGKIRGRVRDREWNSERLLLPTNSMIMGVSVGEFIRGKRPDWIIMDDPEDEDEIRNPELRELFCEWLFKVLLNTLDPGRHISWIGTLVDRRALLTSAVRHKDDRFCNWKTKIYNLIETDKEGKEFSTWDEKYTVEEANLMASGKGSEDGRIRGMGKAAFLSEFQAQPTDAQDPVFPFEVDRHTYQIASQGDNNLVVSYPSGLNEIGETVTTYIKFQDWLGSLQKVACIDLAISQSLKADNSCIMVCGLDDTNTLWVVDYVARKMQPPELIERLLRMVDAYDIGLIGIETNDFQKLFYDQIMDAVKKRLKAHKKCPFFKQLPHYGVKKAVRIASLQWRFAQGKIRIRVPSKAFPRGMRSLTEQIEGFTMSLGGLDHDDELDALAMTQEVLVGLEPTTRQKTPEQQRIQNTLKDLGISPVLAYNADEIPDSYFRHTIREQMQTRKGDRSMEVAI